MSLKPRFDRTGWVIVVIVALFSICIALGIEFFSFPRHSNWSSFSLGVGSILAIVLAVHQANRRKQIQKRGNQVIS